MRSFLKTSCICAVLMMLVSTTVHSQQTVSLQQDNSPTILFFLVPHHNPLFGLGYINPNKSLVEVAEGSQFYDEEFKELKAPSSGRTIKARYNAFFDEMEIQREEEQGWINKYRHNDRIVFAETDKAFKILDADARPEKSALGYYEILLESQYVSLYKKNAKKLHVAMESAPYMVPPPRIVTEFQPLKSEYYIEFHNSGNVQKLSRTRGGVSKLFEDKKDIVKAYIKENKLKVTKDQDLIKIMTYVNSL